MEHIAAPLKNTSSPPSSERPSTASTPSAVTSAPPPVRKAYGCSICGGAGWLYASGPDDPNAWEPGPYGKQTKLVRCSCKDGDNQARQIRYLDSIDGLTETERLLAFDVLVEGKFNAGLARTVRNAVALRRGLITLSGKPGTGKSTMLICAVNAAKAANIPAVYSTMADLLDYLRAAYHPDAKLNADKRWDLLTTVAVLAIDELDQFNTTPWALDRFAHLMDMRWRNMDRRLTLCATNVAVSALPEKVESRLKDGRAQLFHTEGPDMRPMAQW